MNNDFYLKLRDFIPLKGLSEWRERASQTEGQDYRDNWRHHALISYNSVVWRGFAFSVMKGLEAALK